MVVVPFPFSNLTQVKKRPALVLAAPSGGDILLCQITSKEIRDEYAVAIKDSDFETGGLTLPSQVRPNKIFTADKAIVLYRAGALKAAIMGSITERVIRILTG